MIKFTFFLLAFAGVASASHFRYLNLFWDRRTFLASDTTSLKVHFTLAQGWIWRSDTLFQLGDGSSHLSQPNDSNKVFENTVDGWTSYAEEFDHTYPATNVYEVTAGGCCRISTLLDGNRDSKYDFSLILNIVSGATALLVGPTHSPQTAGNPIIHFTVNQMNTMLPPYPSHPTHQQTARWSTPSESGLNKAIPGRPSNTASLSPAGELTWKPEEKGLYAVQIKIDAHTPNNANSPDASSILDFIIKVDDAAVIPLEEPYYVVPPQYLSADGAFHVCNDGSQDVMFRLRGKADESVANHASARVSIQFSTLPQGASVTACEEGADANGFAPGHVCTVTVSWNVPAGQIADRQLLFNTIGQNLTPSPTKTVDITIEDCGFFNSSPDARCDGVALAL